MKAAGGESLLLSLLKPHVGACGFQGVFLYLFYGVYVLVPLPMCVCVGKLSFRVVYSTRATCPLCYH